VFINLAITIVGDSPLLRTGRRSTILTDGRFDGLISTLIQLLKWFLSGYHKAENFSSWIRTWYSFCKRWFMRATFLFRLIFYPGTSSERCKV